MKSDHTVQQHEDNTTMFSKLPHYYQHQHHRYPSEKPNTSSGGGATAGGDGASVEVTRRPRGRPPGSKNKPKPPLVITRDADCAMRPLFLELPNGVDIIESLDRFCRKRNIGLSILTASGAVTNVSLRQPSGGNSCTLHGRFEILSISATFLAPTLSPSTFGKPFAISLVGPRGQIVGGSVTGSLIAAGTVFLMAASFTNPDYHRLPIEEDELSHSPSGGGGGGGSGAEARITPAEPMYSCHLPSDVIWVPTATRQPPPPPHY